MTIPAADVVADAVCPICGGRSTARFRRHSLAAAAEHFVPRGRDPIRRERLEGVLHRLWDGRDSVDVRRCASCGFGFASPNVAGDRDFYNLVSNGDPHYPGDRWEFTRTIAELADLSGLRGDLLECGAGDGAFLERLRSSPAGARFTPMATEYDEGALRRLRAAGFAGSDRSITELGDDCDGRFTVICMFQTLEHIADAHAVFDAFRRVGRPGSHVFASVPNAAAIDLQERLARYWDMPPNHVGRWLPACFTSIAAAHGLELVSCEIEPVSRLRQAWKFAVYQVNGQAYDPRSVAGRINAIESRLVRGPLKRLLAALLFMRLFVALREPPGDSLWVHLRNAD